jgi:transposase-like protein
VAKIDEDPDPRPRVVTQKCPKCGSLHADKMGEKRRFGRPVTDEQGYRCLVCDQEYIVDETLKP